MRLLDGEAGEVGPRVEEDGLEAPLPPRGRVEEDGFLATRRLPIRVAMVSLSLIHI